ncbi:MAG: DUF3592 domain-containing protein [Cyclobacteriaceae bacterium]|jgi:hypothetical protein|nr:DUF3592 domain-containing protein [Cyclobacteriaceae bacterium]
MNFEEQLKQEAIRLIRAGEPDEARELFQQQLNISSTDAERLIQALTSEAKIPSPVRVHQPATGCVSIVLKLAGFFMAFMAFTFLVFALISYQMQTPFTEGARINAKVTGFNIAEGGEVVAILEYDWNGTLYQSFAKVVNDPPDFEVGQTIPILVNPNNPEQIVLDTFSERYSIALWMGGFGVFFTLMAVILFIAARKVKVGFDK